MKLYVGNLDSSINDEQLRQIFAAQGTVNSATVITDKFSGASRGFGFVEMSDAEGAQAIKALDGQQHGRNTLRVNEARAQASDGRKRFAGGGGGKRSGGGRDSGRGWNGGRY